MKKTPPTTADTDERELRWQTILAILSDEEIAAQEELVKRLARRGFRVTQSSVSRDLTELQVAKVGGRYQRLDQEAAARPAPAGELNEILGASLVGARAAGAHLLVLTTVTGAAQQVALAIDKLGWREIAGTVAGDDTIFVATAGLREQKRVLARLRNYLKAGSK